ncbi:hypothetical protein Tco_0758266 [Tanacetum coccineum]
MERGFLSSGWRGRGVMEKDKHGMAAVNTMKTATIGKNAVVYVNEAGQATINVDASALNKRDYVNSNENVKPTATASLPAFVSFATLLKGDTTQKNVNFHTFVTPAGNGADVALPLESIRVVNEWNTWSKYGLVKSMLNSPNGLFFFQFNSKVGLDAMLENGPWFILNNPLILKKWAWNLNSFKEDVSNVPVWVKLHGVHMTAFNEDGLSAIVTKIGLP